MKILFICGSLEPGCDGVGDYVRKLAKCLHDINHKAAALALCDRHVDKAEAVIDKYEETFGFSIFRIPSNFPSTSIFMNIKEWISDFNPDVISLQYVPFAYHSKGLPHYLPALVKRLSDGKKIHCMFHELWVGMEKQASYKMKAWGKIQEYLIKRLIQKVSPASITTNTLLYQAQLHRMGFNVALLPLFSNIPLAKSIKSEDYFSKSGGSSTTIIFCIFGTIQKNACPQNFISEIMELGQKRNINFVLRFLGRNGNPKPLWLKICKEYDLTVEDCGEKPPEEISRLLATSTAGITTNPVILAQKSGTIAAMQQHGLQVFSIADRWEPQNGIAVRNAAGVVEFSIQNFDKFLKGGFIKPVSISVSDIAHQFVRLISQECQREVPDNPTVGHS